MSEGVWLDQIPPGPPQLVACVGCGDPLQPLDVMIKWIEAKPVTPLCRGCFDAPDLSSWDALKAENLPPCPRCGNSIEPGQYIISDGGHHICP